MATHKVLSAYLPRMVDGKFVVHRAGEILENLAKKEADRLLRLRSVALVDANGKVRMPAPNEETPLLEPDLEDPQVSAGKHAAVPEAPPADPAAPVDPADPEAAGQAPRGNASLDEWVAYAKTQGATDEELAGLSRDQVRDKYAAAPTA
jgi:hypothetical protein